MKKILFFFLLSLIVLPAEAQDSVLTKLPTYRDAAYLAKLYKKASRASGRWEEYTEDKKNFINTLRKYNIEFTKESLCKNPFLQSECIAIYRTINSEIHNSIGTGDEQVVDPGPYILPPTSKSLLSTISSYSWQGAMLQGTASFMAQRFKDELTSYSVGLLLTKIENHKELEVLFQHSYKYIKNLNRTGVYYASDLNQLRYHAELDLQDLPQNSFESIRQKIPNTNRHLLFMLDETEFYYTLLQEFGRQSNPSQAIDILVDRYKTEHSELVTVQLLNYAFRDVQPSDRIWISADSLKDKDVNLFFKALLYQQLESAGSDIGLQVYVDNYAENFPALFRKLEDSFNSLRQSKTPSFDLLKDYLLQVFYIYEPILKVKYSNIGTHVDLPTMGKILTKTLDLSNTITEKQYSFIFPQLLSISTDIYPEIFISDSESFRLLSFLIDLTMVKDGGEVQDLIQAAVLPIGSAAIKRANKISVTINGYVGATIGAEGLKGADIKSTGLNYGLTAPIGFTLSFKNMAKKGSWSIFASVLDIGSLVNQNLSDEVSTDTDVRFEQFLAPGLGLFYNVGKSPFTLGVHGTYNPAKREYNSVDQHSRHIDTWRFNASVLVDIPFFNLHIGK
ncbi:hypothetical protein [Sphingobacterium haloxyli]|uniref:Outer membrane protein beta-barrel domain-containing protein n=1 Tax=Sphingobacterium haloxyli TaxID=2100533 RepID=A0A2S9IZY4_9SPHI|nr:hypothetical protein [Sphingobacterium haloxyli]PRD46089.1 hypothetical protein C5745_16830 [Sphingobacterium haloxyli]